jgi:purine-binding chemotaxis protein CheW
MGSTALTDPVAPTDDVGVATARGPRVMLMQAGGQQVALDALHAREVMPAAPAIRLPGAPPVVSGVVTVRGALVPLLDLGRLLAEAPATQGGWHVLVEQGTQRLVLAVERMPTLAQADAMPNPLETPTGVLRSAVSIAGSTVPLMDTDALAAVVLLP